MDKTEIREEARVYFIPFLLGNNSAAHRLARKIHRKYKITCYILDTKISFADIISTSSKFIKLTDTKSNAVRVEELLYLAKQTPYTLPILVPCTTDYEDFIDTMHEALESSFVISSMKDVLSASPLSVIP